MSDDPTEALPPRGRSLRISIVEEFANTLRVLARLLDHFGMNIRSLFVCSALLLFASVAYGAGSYQRTRDGKTLVWNDSPKRGEEATWSGKRDKKGFAVGSGTLTWYKVVPTIETGSLIPDTRHAVVVKRYSGKMVHGKFKGAVTYVDANGRKRSVNPTPNNRQSPRKKATPAPTPAGTVPQPQSKLLRQLKSKRPRHFRAHPWTSHTDLEVSSRAEPFARRTRNPTAVHNRRPLWHGNRRRPERQSNKPDNLMPKAQSCQYQPRLTILCARSPRRQ